MSLEVSTLGRHLKRLRREQGHTQESLAERADVSVDLIAKLEQGRRHSARVMSLMRLATALDVDLSDLVGKRDRIGADRDGRQVTRDLSLPRVFVNALAVRRSHWRGGAGTELMKAVEQWARERGARLIPLDTYADSPLSVPFYEHRIGYQRQSIVFAKSLD
jgi:transcriptional regulator with XRE-family HTH domain